MLNVILNNVNLVDAILTPILAAVGTALAGAITFGITRLIALINRKIGNEKLARAVEIIGDIVIAAVETTNQRFVDDLKKEGKFNKENQKLAFEMTLATVKQMLTEETEKILREAFGDIEVYIATLIEQFVSNIPRFK